MNNKVITTQGNVQFQFPDGKIINVHPNHIYTVFNEDTVSFILVGLPKTSGLSTMTSKAEDLELNGAVYSFAELPNAVSEAFAIAGAQARCEIVDELPETGYTNTIYLVPQPAPQTGFDEYVYILDQGWELIGDTSIEMDNYVLKTVFSGYTADTAVVLNGLRTDVDTTSGNVITETERALLAESGLSDSIDAEEAAREAADGIISGAVDTVSSGLTQEVERAIAAESGLSDAINAVSGDVISETSRAEAAEDALDGKIDAVSGNVETEEARAISAETALDNKIDVVSAATDTALSGKQDTLIAGENITISSTTSGDVISAEGGGKAISAGTNISVTTGETADIINCTLNAKNGTGKSSFIANGHIGGAINSATGAYATTFGLSNNANARASFVIGGSNNGKGEYSFVGGSSSEAKGNNSFAFGYNAKAIGDYSIAFGSYFPLANNTAEVAIGKANVSHTGSTDADKTLFSVGNGTSSSARHNAFEIRQNGDIYITKDGQDVKLQDKLMDANNYYTKSETSGTTELSTAFNLKANVSDLNPYFDNAKYELSGSTHVINFYNGDVVKATIDCSDFIIDGMVDNVYIENGYLVIDFNTESGKQDIQIPLTDIFNPDNYYTKSETSGATELSTEFATKLNTADFNVYSGSVDTRLSEDEEVTSRALNALNETISGKANSSDVYLKTETSGATEIATALSAKLDSTAYTPTDLSNYYQKSETSGATEISTALSNKLDATAYTPTDLSNYYTKSETSGATEIATALSDKVDSSSVVTAVTSASTDSEIPTAKAVWEAASGGGTTYTAGRGIDITNDTISFNLPISAGTGSNTVIMGGASTANGSNSLVVGSDNNLSSGSRNLVVGYNCKRSGDGGAVIGWNSESRGDFAVAFGESNFAAFGSLTQGRYNKASGTTSFALGNSSSAYSTSSFALGEFIEAKNFGEHSIGRYNVSNKANKTWGDSGNTIFSVGNGTSAMSGYDVRRHNAIEVRQNGDIYIADTNDTSTSNYYEKPMIKLQDALGGSSYTAGRGIDITNDTVSFDLPISAGTGNYSLVIASDNYDLSNRATKDGAVALNGYGFHSTYATGINSLAEGADTKAVGYASHAEGKSAYAMADYSHAEGYYTSTINEYEHASGHYNVSNSASTEFGHSGNTLFSVGNGANVNTRHNAFEIRQNGDIYCSDGTNDVKLQDTITATAANTTALGGMKIVKLTESEYAALVTKDSDTLYVVIPDPTNP